MSPLLLLCRDARWSAESIAVLLDRGADVLHRDENGDSCLHFLLRSLQYFPYRLRRWSHRRHWLDETADLDPSEWIHRYSAAIILLIDHGADVRTENRFGRGPGDVAYERYTGRVHDEDDVNEISCARADIWDFSLAMCGFDISGYRRGARYGALYTREDFKDLWAGYEELCPYYYDEENHFSDADDGAYSDDQWWLSTDSEDEGSDGDEVSEVKEVKKVNKVDEAKKVEEVDEANEVEEANDVEEVGEVSKVDDEEWWR